MSVKMAKMGSTVRGAMQAFSAAASLALQYGTPLSEIVKELRHTRFEPAGKTDDPEIDRAKSITDYLARWLEKRFPVGES